MTGWEVSRIICSSGQKKEYETISYVSSISHLQKNVLLLYDICKPKIWTKHCIDSAEQLFLTITQMANLFISTL